MFVEHDEWVLGVEPFLVHRGLRSRHTLIEWVPIFFPSTVAVSSCVYCRERFDTVVKIYQVNPDIDFPPYVQRRWHPLLPHAVRLHVGGRLWRHWRLLRAAGEPPGFHDAAGGEDGVARAAIRTLSVDFNWPVAINLSINHETWKCGMLDQ